MKSGSGILKKIPVKDTEEVYGLGCAERETRLKQDFEENSSNPLMFISRISETLNEEAIVQGRK